MAQKSSNYFKQQDISEPFGFFVPNSTQLGISNGYAENVGFDEASKYIDPALESLEMFSAFPMSRIIPGGSYQFGDGTVSAPSIGFQTDSDTGFYHAAAGEIDITINGVKEAAFNSSGLLISDMTLGSVLFAGVGGQVTQDNASFFWDDTNNRLGILTSSPTVALDVNGDIRDRNMTLGSVLFAGSTGIISQDNSNLFWDDTNNRLGIGCNNPFYALEVREGSFNHQLILSKDDNNAATFQVSGTGMIISGYTTGFGELPFVAIQNDINGLLEFGVYNTRTTGGGTGAAKMLLQIDSTQSGDVYYQLYNGTTIWTHGLDNSDSDKWKLSKNASLGTNDYLTVYTTGDVAFGTGSFYWDNTNFRLGIGSSTPQASLEIKGAYANPYANIGPGTKMGNPTGTIVATSNGAGNVNGTVKYAYYEADPYTENQTGLSPQVTFVASNNKVRITLPLPRPGVIRRVLCRTKAGGSTFYVLQHFSGSYEYFQTLYDDNTTDASLVTAVTDVDNTVFYDLIVRDGVKYISSHPRNIGGPHDFGVFTANPANPGEYAMDIYGIVKARHGSAASNAMCFYAYKTGITGLAYRADFQPDLYDGGTGTQVFSVASRGEINVTQYPGDAETPAAILQLNGGAHTACIASTAFKDVNFNLARTVQFATGAISTLTAFIVDPPTYAFVGASTITDAFTTFFNGAPVAGTNATITRRWGFGMIGNASFNGNVIIGTSPSNGSPTQALDVTTEAATAIAVFDNTSPAVGKGGEIYFQHQGGASNARTNYASVKGNCVSSGAGAEVGDLVLKAMRAGTLSIGATLKGAGAFQVGSATDATALGDFCAGVTGAGRMNYTASTAVLNLRNLAGTDLISIGPWAGSAGYLCIANSASFNSTAWAMIQGGSGDTYLNSASGQALTFRINNVNKAFIASTGAFQCEANANGQNVEFHSATELTTIAAAATTATAIQIPVDAVVLGVTVRVTVAIPTATTFTVTGTTSTTQFDVAGGVAVAANTTDVGTRNCPYKNGAAQTITITPNLTPANNNGRVRVTIHYYKPTVPTS